MNLQELKKKNPAELISEAEKLGIENPSTLRKQEILFAILKKSCRKGRNHRCGCITTFARWFRFFKSNGIKLSTWTR